MPVFEIPKVTQGLPIFVNMTGVLNRRQDSIMEGF